MLAFTILVLQLFACRSLAQFVSQPTDLKTVQGAGGVQVRFKEVPAGICETTPNVRSFAGYADVSATQHIYFWMFEARSVDPTKAPLTVRLDGGPGASSMNSLFSDMGPCTVDAGGNLVNNPFAWNNISNVVFVDSPTTVGFSFTTLTNATQSATTFEIVPTETCTTADPGCGTYSSPDLSLESNSTVAAASVFYSAMQGFMGAFPQYSSNGVHIAGSSYSGHYGPIYSDHILQQNKLNTPGTIPIPLKSLVIQNGFYDTRVQFEAYLNITVSPGNTYDFAPYTPALQAQLEKNLYGAGGCQAQQAACNAVPPPADINNICAAADTFCVAEVEQFFDDNAKRNEEDMRQLAPDPFPPSFYVSYLNDARVQQAIGASTNFTPASIQTFTAFNSTGDDSRTGALVMTSLQSLVQQGVTVAMYAGDADYDSNWLGGQVVADNVNAPGWARAGFVNMTAGSDGAVRGETKQAGAFSFTRVFFAGHVAAFYEPAGALAVFERAITGRDVATGLTPATGAAANVTTAGRAAAGLFREGPGTIQTKVTPPGAVYNTLTHLPEAGTNGTRLLSSKAQVVDLHPMAGVTVKNMKKMMVQERLRRRREAGGRV